MIITGINKEQLCKRKNIQNTLLNKMAIGNHRQKFIDFDFFGLCFAQVLRLPWSASWRKRRTGLPQSGTGPAQPKSNKYCQRHSKRI